MTSPAYSPSAGTHLANRDERRGQGHCVRVDDIEGNLGIPTRRDLADRLPEVSVHVLRAHPTTPDVRAERADRTPEP